MSVVIRYPYDPGTVYESDDGMTIRVRRGDETGTFNHRGQWIAGTVQNADAHFCSFVASGFLIGRPTVPDDQKGTTR